MEVEEMFNKSSDDLLTPLIKEARKFSSSTNQKIICKLLSKVADAETLNSNQVDLLVKLHQCLSVAYDGKLNNTEDWVARLNMELNYLQNHI